MPTTSMVLHVPTGFCLCRSSWTCDLIPYAGPHDIVYHTMMPVCMLVRNDGLIYVDEFRYLGHVLTADCRDNKGVEKKFRGHNRMLFDNMYIRKFIFTHMEQKIQLLKSYLYALSCHLSLLYVSVIVSVIAIHSNNAMFLDTYAPVWHLK